MKNASQPDKLEQAIQFDGDVFSSGFGIIAQIVMRDPRLTPGAKGFYGYICSFAGAGKSAFPARETICSEMNVSKNTYWGWCLELRKCGYIKIITRPKDNLSNLFLILSTPQPDLSITTLAERRAIKKDPDNDTYNPRLNNCDEEASLNFCDEPSLNNCDEPSLNNCDGEKQHLKVTHNNMESGHASSNTKNVVDGAKRSLIELNKILLEHDLPEIVKTNQAKDAVTILLGMDDSSLKSLLLNCQLLKTADQQYDVTIANPVAFMISHPNTIMKIKNGEFPRKAKNKSKKKKNSEEYEIYSPPVYE